MIRNIYLEKEIFFLKTKYKFNLYLYLYLFLLGVRVAYIPNGFFNPIVYSSL